MSNKIIAKMGFVLFLLIIFMSFASADLRTGLVHYYNLSGSGTAADSAGSKDLTDATTAGVTGILEGARYFDGADKLTRSNPFTNGALTSYSANLWINTSLTSGTDYIFHVTDTNAYFGIQTAVNTINFRQSPSGGGWVEGSYAFTDTSSWHMLTQIWTGTRLLGYIDGVLRVNQSIASTNTGSAGGAVGGNVGGAGEYYGDIDELGWWENVVLTQSQIDDLYNSGAACNPIRNPTGCTGTPSTPPSITLSTNLTSYTNSSANPFYFSIDAIGAVVNTTDLWNISVYLNGTLNQTHLNIALNESIFRINLTYGGHQTGYDINVSVEHGYDAATDSFVRNDIFLDSVTPYITFLQPTSNNSVKFKGVNTLFNVSIFCDDPNLYSCNLTIMNMTENSTLDTVLNNSIVTGISTENYTITLWQNVANLEAGIYALIAESADSHTAVNIDDFEWSWIDGKLHIENLIFEGTDLKSTNNKGNLVTYFYKDFDRYKMKVTFNDQALDHEFILTAPQWQYVGDQYGYKGHFVSLAERKWLDFMGQNVQEITVTPLGFDRYLIHVDHFTMTDEIEFESIGQLNVNKVIYYLNITENNFAFNMWIYDEDNPTESLVGSAEVEFNYYIGSSVNVTHYYADLSGSDNYAFNISTNESTITGDLYIKYTTPNGFTHRYIVVNTTFNTTQGYNFTLYNFNTTTGVTDLKITARQNSNYNYFPDVIAKLQRRYTSEGLWRTVQMDQSGDFGVLFFNIREESTDYRIIFTDLNNNVLKTTQSLKFVCTDGLCDLTTLLDPYSAVAASADITASFNYNNDTGLLNFTWSDADAGSNTVRMRARQDTVTGAIYPCDQTQAAAAAGSYSCNVTGRQGVLEVTVIANGVIILSDYIEINVGKIGTQIDEKEGAFWSAIIMIVCVTFGLFSPAGSIITMIIGLILIYVLGIFTPLTLTFVIISTMIGILIGFKVRS